jgi:GTPase SAR1 family protein
MSGVSSGIKVVFVGSALSGKTSVVRKMLGASQDTDGYIATISVEVHPIKVRCDTFNIWDCAGQSALGGLRDGYYIGANIVFVFPNISQETYEKIKDEDNCNLSKEDLYRDQKDWVKDVKRVVPTHCKIIKLESGSLDSLKTTIENCLKSHHLKLKN